jgi:hypothetical protein
MKNRNYEEEQQNEADYFNGSPYSDFDDEESAATRAIREQNEEIRRQNREYKRKNKTH